LRFKLYFPVRIVPFAFFFFFFTVSVFSDFPGSSEHLETYLAPFFPFYTDPPS